MKILLLACLTKTKEGNIFGGAEKSIINLANWLAEKENIVTLASVEGNVQAYPVSNKVNFIGFEINSKSRIGLHIKMFLNTQRVIRECKPDIIIGFWIHPLFYASLNPLNRKIKTIYSERNDPNLEYGYISKIMRWRVMKRASSIVFQTSDAQKYFDEIIQKKSVVIHNPVYIDEEAYLLKNELDNRVVSVGRLNYQKNYSLLIEAFREISIGNSNLKLEIYGEGPLREELQERINKYALQNKIKLMGTYSDVLDKIYGARLFVLPSNYEGMPNALMEAMCLGIPVISSDCPCGGPKELIKHGTNGYLFESNNKDSLVTTMKHVLQLKPYELKNIIENERNIVKTHNSERIFGKWLDVLRKVDK